MKAIIKNGVANRDYPNRGPKHVGKLFMQYYMYAEN